MEAAGRGTAEKNTAAVQLPLQVRFYFDYKSPFSFLAKDQVYAMERDYKESVRFIWLPYAFSVEGSFGLPEHRTDLLRRKVRYAYKDARRFANERGIVIYGPQRVYDSTTALIGGIFAQLHDQKKSSSFQYTSSSNAPSFKKYTDTVFERFFKRQLEIEDADEISKILVECGVDVGDFKNYVEKEGHQRVAEIISLADKDEVFGVPSFIVEGELFFGNDRIDWVRKKLNSLVKPTKPSL